MENYKNNEGSVELRYEVYILVELQGFTSSECGSNDFNMTIDSSIFGTLILI